MGKSTIFNVLTGLNQHVGNWPGKTVERKTGQYRHGEWELELVDLPGTYSLTSNSVEEQIARDFIIKPFDAERVQETLQKLFCNC